jgi:putative heme iron utilization protein
MMPEALNVQLAIQELLQRQQTLVMATTAPDGTPHCSATPFLLHAGNFFILASGLAKHTTNLNLTKCCHIQILADEQETVNPFARKRLSYPCTATEIPLTSPEARELLVALRRRFGPTVDLLGSLPDFRLIQLSPAEGQIILGFGQAHPAPTPSELN